MSSAQSVEIDIGFYLTVSWIGILVSFPSILAHIFIKNFRKTPGGLMLWDFVSWFINWLIILIGVCYYKTKHPPFTESQWSVIAGLWLYSSCIGQFYLLALSLEILIRVKMPLNQHQKWRQAIYHGVCQFVTIIIVLTGGLMDVYGYDNQGQCWIKSGSNFKYVYLVPPIIWMPIWLILTIMAFKTLGRGSMFLLRYLIFICLWMLLASISFGLYVYVHFISDKIPQKVVDAWSGIAWVGFSSAMLYRAAEVTVLKKWWKKSTDKSQGMQLLGQQFFNDVYVEAIQSTMLGLAYAFENIEIQPGPISSKSFTEVKRSRFKLEDQDIPAKSIVVTEYSPQIFAKIREQHDIDPNYLTWIFKAKENVGKVIDNAQNKGGKGGSFFYFTSDNQFIIKSLKEGEKKIMLGKFLPQYYQAVSRESLLSRVYGIFKIKVENKKSITVMIQGNIIDPQSQIIATFDIKGSIKDRKTSTDTITINTLCRDTVYKDQDFDQAIEYFTMISGENLKNIILCDVELLRQNKLMDYSLLMWICLPLEDSESYFYHKTEHFGVYLGIIDYLQSYTLKKQIERRLKIIRNKEEEISVMNPDDYAKRFLNKIDDILRTNNI